MLPLFLKQHSRDWPSSVVIRAPAPMRRAPFVPTAMRTLNHFDSLLIAHGPNIGPTANAHAENIKLADGGKPAAETIVFSTEHNRGEYSASDARL